MSQKLTFLLALVLGISLNSQAQPLAAYTNAQNQIMVFDNGILRKVDYLPPTDMKIGRTTIPYIDNSRSFKVYYGGGVRTLNTGFTNAYQTTDNLMAFQNAQSLNVFEKGTVTNLSRICTEFYVGDSVILFLDGVRTEYKAYYNGAVYPIESYLAGSALSSVKVSDNIAAYNNYARQFHIFFHGTILSLDEIPATSFDVGRNTVAYVDGNNIFKVFHNGKITTLDNFPPTSYTAGDDLVAYVATDGNAKIFYNDSVYNLGYFHPNFKVADNVVCFKDGGGYFKIFYKGGITNIDNYYPTNFTAQYNSMAYVNTAGVLRMFSNGDITDVTNATVDAWELHYDVLKYQIGQNYFRIYYNGQEYE